MKITNRKILNVNKDFTISPKGLFKIDYHGRWYYKDSEIRKESLIKLFAKILQYDKDNYYLITPVEKQKVEVYDAPFLIKSLKIFKEEKLQKINFTTNIDTIVRCGAEHPVIMKYKENHQNIPYIEMGQGISARITRSVYYELANISVLGPKGDMGFFSRGNFFSLEVSNNG